MPDDKPAPKPEPKLPDPRRPNEARNDRPPPPRRPTRDKKG